MSIPPLRDPRPAAPLGDTRQRVFDDLRRAGRAVTAAEVAERLALHLNTARFHLDGLVEHEHAERRTEERGTPGRPRILYSVRGSGDGARSYRLLSQMLVDLVRSLDANGSAATSAGRAWGRALAEQDGDGREADGEPGGDTGVERLMDVMAAVGFAPEMVPGGRTEVHLHNCPFLEVAEGNTDVVCAVHRGLMEGVLEEGRSSVAVDSLVPFATPQACVARLRA